MIGIKTPFEFTHNLSNLRHNELSGIIEAIGRHIEGGYMQYGSGRNDPIHPQRIRILLNDRYPEAIEETANREKDRLLQPYRSKLNIPNTDVIQVLIFREESQELLDNQIHVAFEYGRELLRNVHRQFVTTSAGVVRRSPNAANDSSEPPRADDQTGLINTVNLIQLRWTGGKNKALTLNFQESAAFMLGGHLALQDKELDIPEEAASSLTTCRYQFLSQAMTEYADQGILLTFEDGDLWITNLSTQRIDLKNGQMALVSKSSASLAVPETLIMGPFKLSITAP